MPLFDGGFTKDFCLLVGLNLTLEVKRADFPAQVLGLRSVIALGTGPNNLSEEKLESIRASLVDSSPSNLSKTVALRSHLALTQV